MVALNIEELKDFGRHIIENNRDLQKRGLNLISFAVEGDSGIGKTSSIIQLANEMGLKCVKLNLAQIEELGDLVGFPIRQFKVGKVDTHGELECIWIDEHAVESYTHQGYGFTGENRMSYCPPEWIADMQPGGMLILDDFNRAD